MKKLLLKRHFPRMPTTFESSTLSKIRCHTCHVATQKLANNVELMMAYNFRSLGKVSFVIRVSIRFNGVSVMVMKQGIVPCKLLIAASEITVFLGSNITDVTPFFSPSEALTIPPPKKNLPAGLM